MDVDSRALAVIESLYDAAMNDALWPTALQRLTDFTGSQSATLWLLDGSEQPRLPLLLTYNFDDAFMHAYLDGMVPLDPTVQYLVRHPHAPIVHDDMVISEREKDRSPYYDWHGRWSDTRFRMVGQMSLGPAIQAGVALHRARGCGRFERTDVERFGALHGHLERALAISRRLGSVGALQQTTAEVLDRHPAAIVFLDKRKNVVYSNRQARTLQEHDDGLCLAGDGLLIEHRPSQERFQLLFMQALRTADDSTSAPGVLMRVPRPSGKRPYSLFLVPIARHRPVWLGETPAVCIIVTDPEAQQKLPIPAIQAGFGLTRSEAELAALLAHGDDLRSAAEALQVTYGTARARLSEIFHKTGTCRQAELIKVLLATMAPII
jgi:DNA-binding CsgD family transcriptional regulator